MDIVPFKSDEWYVLRKDVLSRKIIRHHLIEKLPKEEFEEIVKCNIKSSIPNLIVCEGCSKIMHVNDSRYHLVNNPITCDVKNILENYRNIYKHFDKSIIRAYYATIFTLMYSKNVLGRDLSRKIAIMIFNSRYDIFLWRDKPLVKPWKYKEKNKKYNKRENLREVKYHQSYS